MKLVTALSGNQRNACLPQKLVCGSLDRLQIGQVELQKNCILSSAGLEFANGGLTLGLVTAGNVDSRVFRKEDLIINMSI